MRVYYCGDYVNIEIGQEVTVARSSTGHAATHVNPATFTRSGYTACGEPATLTGTTNQHMIFTTKSGKTVKCPIDNLSYIVGKADKAGYFIIPRKFEGVENIIRESVIF